MSYDAILQVTKAEKTAQEMLLQAQADARERLLAAHNAADEALRQARAQVGASLTEALNQERERSMEYAARHLAVSQEDCEQLREKASVHLDAAVSRVMERILVKWHS